MPEITQTEMKEFLTAYQVMRAFQSDYFSAAKKAAAERNQENFDNRKECLERSKMAETRLDRQCSQLLMKGE